MWPFSITSTSVWQRLIEDVWVFSLSEIDEQRNQGQHYQEKNDTDRQQECYEYPEI